MVVVVVVVVGSSRRCCGVSACPAEEETPLLPKGFKNRSPDPSLLVQKVLDAPFPCMLAVVVLCLLT